MIGDDEFAALFFYDLVARAAGDDGFKEALTSARDQQVAADRAKWGDTYLRRALNDMSTDLLAGKCLDVFDDEPIAEAAVASDLLAIGEALGIDTSVLRFRALSTEDRAIAALKAS